jgi:hypothetical protein
MLKLIKTSKFADCWNTSKVFPLYKGSEKKSHFSNYRPINARHKSLYVCVIAIDFKKAFDILCRKI